MPAKFYEHDVKAKLKGKRKLSVWLDELVKKHVSSIDNVELAYIFCDDKYLLEINKNYLSHNTYTDIITFDLSEPGMMGGEIYISVERVRENADTYKTSYKDELHRVIFHGVLHLCGFKDKKPADIKVMRLMEDQCLEEYKKATK